MDVIGVRLRRWYRGTNIEYLKKVAGTGTYVPGTKIQNPIGAVRHQARLPHYFSFTPPGTYDNRQQPRSEKSSQIILRTICSLHPC